METESLEYLAVLTTSLMVLVLLSIGRARRLAGGIRVLPGLKKSILSDSSRLLR